MRTKTVARTAAILVKRFISVTAPSAPESQRRTLLGCCSNRRSRRRSRVDYSQQHVLDGGLTEGDDFDGTLHAIVALLTKQGDWCRKFTVDWLRIDVTVNYDLDLGITPPLRS